MWVDVNGRIADIGDRDTLTAAAGPEVRVVSLNGATVLPGFVDAHLHLGAVAYLADAVDCRPSTIRSIPEIQARMAVADARSDGWVTATGYQDQLLAEGRHPTRWDLDEAVPDRPAVLYHASLHACVVNSKGLSLLAEASGRAQQERLLGHDSAGGLNGLMFEAPMFELISTNMRKFYRSLERSAVGDLFRALSARLASAGVTSCTDANVDAMELETLTTAAAQRGLLLRTRVLLNGADPDWVRRTIAEAPRSETQSGNLSIGGVKLFADGGLSSRTAAVDRPYQGTRDRGLLLLGRKPLASRFREYERSGTQVAVHAQGERAIRAVLGAVEDSIPPGNPVRHRIEHGGAFPGPLRADAARLGMLVVSQPGFISQLGDGFIDAFGPARSKYLFPFRSLLDSGVALGASSDAPIADPAPLAGIRDAIVRRTTLGEELNPDEALSLEEGIAMYTAGSAYAGFGEDSVGELSPGKQADFLVIDGDPQRTAPERLPDLSVTLTVVAGRIVFDGGRPYSATSASDGRG